MSQPQHPPRRDANPIPDEAQRVFDTVTGPNVSPLGTTRPTSC